MSGSLHDVNEKIRRADVHLRHLADHSDAVDKACIDAITCDRDDQTGERIYKLMKVPDVPADVPLIIGDCIHNLRSALDHLAWQIVLACNKHPRTGNNGTSFPIKYNRHGRPDIAPGVNKKIRKLLDEVQPYTRYPPRNHELFALNALDIGDKHHGLLVTVVGMLGPGWFGEWTPSYFDPGPYEDGDEVVRFWPDGDPEADFKPHLTFAIHLDSESAGPFRSMYGAEDWIREQPLRYIQQDVLPRFAYLFRPRP